MRYRGVTDAYPAHCSPANCLCAPCDSFESGQVVCVLTLIPERCNHIRHDGRQANELASSRANSFCSAFYWARSSTTRFHRMLHRPTVQQARTAARYNIQTATS